MHIGWVMGRQVREHAWGRGVDGGSWIEIRRTATEGPPFVDFVLGVSDRRSGREQQMLLLPNRQTDRSITVAG